jgi:hypothetical protein
MRFLKVGCLLVLAALPGCLWISARLDAREGERLFRSYHLPGKTSYHHLNDYQWADAFVGHAGLRRLQLISADRTFHSSSRKTAADVCVYIEQGAYRRELERWVEETPILESPKASARWRYLYYREWLFTVFAVGNSG